VFLLTKKTYLTTIILDFLYNNYPVTQWLAVPHESNMPYKQWIAQKGFGVKKAMKC